MRKHNAAFYRQVVVSALAIAMCGTRERDAGAQQVMGEAVGAYTACYASNQPNAYADTAGFMNGMVGAPHYFTQGVYYQDNSTWDLDFSDPDLAGANANDDDFVSFDAPAVAISYFHGHGQDRGTPQGTHCCTQASQCTSPPAGYVVGTLGTGTCVFTPLSEQPSVCNGQGQCMYSNSPMLRTCSTFDQNGHAAFTQWGMALGENPTVGAWAGAGTNGGTSMAVVHMSWGLIPFFPFSEWQAPFAGLQIYAGVMPTWGDTNDSADFGSAVAATYRANPLSAVGNDYVNSISSITSGMGCTSGFSGGGFNGCGCNVAIAFSTSGNNAVTVIEQNWTQLASGTFKSLQTGRTWASWVIACNYNMNTYPWYGGY